ncbi:MAG: DUF6726 family protein [Thermodesulfobacteriota bacterium]|nr:DUF6726 family protein [Thermodesulfobacteriota bacterium]
MKFVRFCVFLILIVQLCGCVLTKVVSVPMRVGGAVVSIVPVVGNTADDAIDKIADTVDEVPL